MEVVLLTVSQVASNLTGKVAKKTAKKALSKAAEKASEKIGEKTGELIGDKIVNKFKPKSEKITTETKGDQIVELLKTYAEPTPKQASKQTPTPELKMSKNQSLATEFDKLINM